MLNDPWLDPRTIDWTDSPNPIGNPGYRKNNNRYVFNALQDPFMLALRLAKGIEPRIYLGPDPQDNTIPAGNTQDYEVPIEPNFWCYAMAASGSGRDFLVNVTDSVTGATFFSSPVSMATINPARNGTSGRGPQFFLSTPHLFTPPSYPVIRVINTTNSAQVCRVTLYGCVEYDV